MDGYSAALWDIFFFSVHTLAEFTVDVLGKILISTE